MKLKGELTIEYMLEHDIDVFFMCQGYPVFLASRGCILPELLRDGDYLHNMKQKVLAYSENLRNSISEVHPRSWTKNFWE